MINELTQAGIVTIIWTLAAGCIISFVIYRLWKVKIINMLRGKNE